MKIRLVLLTLGWLAATGAHAQEAMTGMFRMTHTVGEILGEQAARSLDEVIPASDALQWQVYVPFDYDPSRPPGVLVFLDSTGYGGIPDPLVATMNQHNLIWVGPRQGQRRQGLEQRVWHAVLGLRAIEGQYTIDLNRVYVGSSGETSSIAFNTYLFANEFRGAIYFRGGVRWVEIGADQLDMLRRKRHVFITGSNDKARDQVRRAYEEFENSGIENIKLIYDTKRVEDNPTPEQIDEAIRFLDGTQ